MSSKATKTVSILFIVVVVIVIGGYLIDEYMTTDDVMTTDDAGWVSGPTPDYSKRVPFKRSSPTATTAPGMAGTYSVKYVVEGTAFSVSITMSNAQGGTEQYAAVRVPWSTSFGAEPGTFLYVSAQNQGKTGSVEAKIYVDGHLIAESTSKGSYVIATASEVLP